MATGQPLTDYDECIRAPDGSERWYMTSKVALRNRHGKLVAYLGLPVTSP
jgi:hypothetical protein